MQLSPTSGAQAPNDLIPNGFLCWALLTFRGMKNSQNSEGRYADIELTVAANQPFERKKLWTRVGDPDHQGNSEKYRNMGMVSLTRMLEAAGLVNAKDAATYANFNGKTCDQVMAMLDGKYVAVRVKVENGEGGFQDKNDVGDWLTPNEQSGGYKNFVKLSNRDHGITANPAAARAPAAGAGAFGGGNANSNAQQQAPAGGFGGQQGGQGGGAGAPFAPSATMTSPSEQVPPARTGFDPNKAPAFLQQ